MNSKNNCFLLDKKNGVENCKDTTITSVCTICLSTSKDAINLCNEDEKSKEILENLFKCFQITLLNDKRLPSVICKACVEDLNITNNLRLKFLVFAERFSVIPEKFIKKEFKEETVEEETTIHINDTSYYNQVSSKAVKKTKFECNVCNELFRSNVLYQKHLQYHNAPHIGKITGFGTNRRYHCAECSFNTNNRQTLKKHFRRHTGERPYKCECGKSFAQQSSLSYHKLTHTTSKNYTCTKCGKQFKFSSAFRTHSRVHETAQFQCTICNKKFKHRHGLREHMYRHNNVRNYSCEECGKTFVSSSALADHKRNNHNKAKKVECHQCGYKTDTKKDLIFHLKEHADYKAYKCNTCKETFNTTNELRRHKRVHYKDKPFSCPLCVHKFTYSSRLNKHMLTFHNTNDKGADGKRKESLQQKRIN